MHKLKPVDKLRSVRYQNRCDETGAFIPQTIKVSAREMTDDCDILAESDFERSTANELSETDSKQKNVFLCSR